jgi:hypothetical protein
LSFSVKNPARIACFESQHTVEMKGFARRKVKESAYGWKRSIDVKTPEAAASLAKDRWVI